MKCSFVLHHLVLGRFVISVDALLVNSIMTAILRNSDIDRVYIVDPDGESLLMLDVEHLQALRNITAEQAFNSVMAELTKLGKEISNEPPA
jgi:hypothetical protein